MNSATDVPIEELERELRSQFRLRNLQVYNWGTFSDLYTINVAGEGFLILGKSGAGKSTLLDAHTALLTPPRWINFNVAARENASGHRDRNFASYVRGAFGDRTTETGEFAPQYLRTGTTWTAIAETYRNAEGHVVVLVRLLWIRGAGTSNRDVRHLHIVLERDFDLRELEFFAKSDFDVRKLRAELPEAHIRDEFSAYQERFKALLGIESDQALRLLHKTQSTKNLEDLNEFLRNFMLDEPETFIHAARLVEEFGELNAAHASVVAARRQIETLEPARQAYESRMIATRQRLELVEARDGVDPYVLHRREFLLVALLDELARQEDVIQARVDQAIAITRQREDLLQTLEDKRRNEGGENIARIERDLEQAGKVRDDRKRRRDAVEHVCHQLGETTALDPGTFATIQRAARQSVDASPDEATRRENQRYELKSAFEKAEQRFGELRREIDVMERQKSNIDSRLLSVRAGIAEALNIAESRLPFAGELIQVRDEAQDWRGAIERVLRNFARSILVDEQDYRAFSAYVDANHLGEHVVYLRMIPKARSDQLLAANSLVRKLELAPGAQKEWLAGELRARFDYTCANSLEDFRRSERAITRKGQIRHNQTRHEKNDRFAVDDSRQWVLGFDNAAKRDLFRHEAVTTAQEIEHLRQTIRKATDDEQRLRERERLLVRLIDLSWADIDVAGAMLHVQQLEAQLSLERAARPHLDQLERDIVAARMALKNARDVEQDARVDLASIRRDAEKASQGLADIRQSSAVNLTPHQREVLDARFASVGRSVTLESLARVAKSVADTLHEEEKVLQQRIAELEHIIRDRFAQFNRDWAAEAGGLDPVMDSAVDYFAKLERLVQDGLPAYEQRFLDLLRKQSDENLTRLATGLVQERKAIQERLELVNLSLSSCEFNPETFLSIESKDLSLEEVRTFQQELRGALSRSLDGDKADAERRFDRLQHVVKRLSGQEAADRTWRALVLDVRQHVEFVAREFDREFTDREIEVYRGGASKSGGQRLKLASTCLAAALRYQLAGDSRRLPKYSTVLLDEAFDKTDNDFTEAAMNIFRTFGFQMIVATPLKQVMTLEPFVGGAVVVQIRDRRASSLIAIEYDAPKRRLDMQAARRAVEGL